jgi:hypothetical protein
MWPVELEVARGLDPTSGKGALVLSVSGCTTKGAKGSK